MTIKDNPIDPSLLNAESVKSRGNKIYPDVDVSEIIKKAKKSPLGRFAKQYKKGDFVYTTEKKLFQERVTVAVYIPTKKVFVWNIYFLEWDDTDFKFE